MGNDLRGSGEMRGFLGKPHTCGDECLHARILLNSLALRCNVYMNILPVFMNLREHKWRLNLKSRNCVYRPVVDTEVELCIADVQRSVCGDTAGLNVPHPLCLLTK